MNPPLYVVFFLWWDITLLTFNQDSESEEIVNVDFDYFDPGEIDFHAIKNLLRQLLDTDSTLFDLSSISDMIISQGAMGSTVKTDGKESDPFALLTVLNMKENKVGCKPGILGSF